MTKKRALLYALIALLLAVLVYVQFRTWRNFDWGVFLSQTRRVGVIHILAGIACTYLAYGLRALRWRIFLRPVKKTSSARLERIFDFGAFATLLITAIFWSASVRHLNYYDRFRKAGLLLVVLVAGLALAAAVISLKGELVAAWAERGFSGHVSGLGHKIATRVREFRGGLNTIHGSSELVQLIAVSLVIWYVIALAYQQITSSYGLVLLQIPVSQVLLLMFASMVGSLVQLPGVGGGSQLATISTLQHVFKAPPELAASCGILLWLVTFMTVIPRSRPPSVVRKTARPRRK